MNVMNGFSALTIIGLTLCVPHAYAQTGSPPISPSVSGVIDGARPGHVPGEGESLPLSNNASNIAPSSTHSDIAPTLPKSGLGADNSPRAYLQEARDNLVATGRTGQAQQALEMAETRMLTRVVPPSQNIGESSAPGIGLISGARQALGRGDIADAIRLIDLALLN
jgi:hypothetical protein